MKDMIFENGFVVIPIEKYRELIGIEVKVSVAAARANVEKYIEVEDVLLMLGTKESVEVGEKIKAEKDKRFKEWAEKNQV